MLLSYSELCVLAETGVITGVKRESINASSIDIHLGKTILCEGDHEDATCIVDYSKRQSPIMYKCEVNTDGFILAPGAFILAQSAETFNLPPDISCEYKLKSSMARIGLEHMNAGWCDAGWNGSVLTLEFKNMMRNHYIRIRAGDAIGQMIFFRHTPVPADRTYAARGRYNGDKAVSGIKE